jgi:hypothetical protein
VIIHSGVSRFFGKLGRRPSQIFGHMVRIGGKFKGAETRCRRIFFSNIFSDNWFALSFFSDNWSALPDPNFKKNVGEFGDGRLSGGVNRRDRADDDADHHHAEFRLHAHDRVNFERVGSSLAAIPRGAGPPGSRRRVPFGTRRPRLGAATTTVGPRSRAESTAATTPSISSDSGRPDSVFLRFFQALAAFAFPLQLRLGLHIVRARNEERKPAT